MIRELNQVGEESCELWGVLNDTLVTWARENRASSAEP